MRAALGAAGVPAVMAGGGSVFATDGARSWLVLLEALEQPHRAGRVRAAALSVFLPCDEASLDRRGDALTDELGPRLRRWADLLAERGVAAVRRRCSPPSRVARPGAGPPGRRAGAHRPAARRPGAARRGRPGVPRTDRAGGVAAPADRPGRGGGHRGAQPAAGVRRRRGAGDDRARQQGPGVPGRARALRLGPLGAPRTRRCCGCTTTTGARVLHVGGPDVGRPRRPRGHSTTTRSPARTSGCSTSRSPGRPARSSRTGHPARTPGPPRCTGCCSGARPAGAQPAATVPVPADDVVASRLDGPRPGSAGLVSVAEVGRASAAVGRRAPAGHPARRCRSAPSPARLDQEWRRTSYSSLTRDAHEVAADQRARTGGYRHRQDERDDRGRAAPGASTPAACPPR